MRIILCDRCGTKITKEEPIGHITVYGEANGHAQGNNDFAGWDFCPDCMEEISNFIKTPLAFRTPDECKDEFVDDLDEKLDIESGDEPISEPINKPTDEPKEDPADEPKEKIKAASKPEAKRREIDWPKFKACVDAGKDNHWLAVEFGADNITVSKWKYALSKKIAEGKIK